MTCMCGDSECPSCGRMQGTYTGGPAGGPLARRMAGDLGTGDLDPAIRRVAVGHWLLATKDQQTLVRFGIVPKELYDDAVEIIGEMPDLCRLYSLALFECARHDGGMLA
jgi:hypothetical protein